jgi:hypothetical protein
MLLFFGTTCTGSSSVTCSCPANGCDHGCDPSTVAAAAIPIGPPLPAVSSVSADSPCSAEYQPSADRILVSHPGEGMCNVRVQFIDGSSDTAQVRFTKMSSPCGCYLGGYASALAPADAGSD